jgi:16S rRNA (guanine966-N2)-methyltransferase
MLRLNTGRLKGRTLSVPNLPNLRPTTARVRQSVLERLNPYLPQARVLDGFAGSGVIGLEAWSRGAQHVTALEKQPQAVKSLQQTLRQWKIPEAEFTVLATDLERWLHRFEGKLPPFDILYLDPPYQEEALIERVVAFLRTSAWLWQKTLLLVEQPRCRGASPVWAHGMTLLDYGDTVIYWGEGLLLKTLES